MTTSYDIDEEEWEQEEEDLEVDRDPPPLRGNLRMEAGVIDSPLWGWFLSALAVGAFGFLLYYQDSRRKDELQKSL